MRTGINSSWAVAAALPILLAVGNAGAQVAPSKPAAEKPAVAAKKEAQATASAPEKKEPRQAQSVSDDPAAEPQPWAGGEKPEGGAASPAAKEGGAEAPAAETSALGDIDLSAGEEGSSASRAGAKGAAATEGDAAAQGDAAESPVGGSAEAQSSAQAKEVESPEPRQDYSALPWTHHMEHLDLLVGLRVNSALDDGLEPFLESPVFAEAVARLGGVIFSSQPVALAVLGEVGGTSFGAGVRGADSHLSLFHMSAGVEGRYFLHPRFYGYARLMAGAEVAWMRYSDFDQEATDSGWAFTGDGVLGAALRVVGSPDGRKRSARVWLFGEGGYRYSTAHEVKLEFDESTGPTRAQPLVFDDFASSGFMGSLGLMVTY